MIFFDTHAHLDDEVFDHDLDGVVQRALDVGVRHVVVVGTTAQSSAKSVQIANQHENLHAAVGIQPNFCHDANPSDWDQIVELANEPVVVGVGETGLDRYWDYSPFPLQQEYFRRHVRLSRQTGLPFIVHMRDCGDEIIGMLRRARERGPLRGVMHSFTGDQALARTCIELGLYISFAGMVTFKKSSDLREVAAAIPDDRVLIETDSPYLSPHPKRGHRPNEPSLLIHTAACLAEVRRQSLEEFAALTTNNAKRLFRL